ncbi:hypothetical protein CGCSCA1_v011188 [Colletotrichum siamense]|nr:hypothetical protein CGCSCA1_v011188 [Colletotrichum siamense]
MRDFQLRARHVEDYIHYGGYGLVHLVDHLFDHFIDARYHPCCDGCYNDPYWDGIYFDTLISTDNSCIRLFAILSPCLNHFGRIVPRFE